MKKQMQNNIDISTNAYLNSYKCKQGDIIKWIVDLSDLGANVDLTGRTVICNIVKANNTFLKQTSGIVITGSKIDITLDAQATQIPGQTKLSLTISKTGEKATTFSKILEVEKNDTEDLVPSTNIVTIIDQLDAKILEANNTKTALDTSINNGNVAKIRADVDKNIADIATANTNIAKNTTDITTNKNDITFLNAEIFDAKEGEPTLVSNMAKKATKTYVDTKATTLEKKRPLVVNSAPDGSWEEVIETIPGGIIVDGVAKDLKILRGRITTLALNAGAVAGGDSGTYYRKRILSLSGVGYERILYTVGTCTHWAVSVSCNPGDAKKTLDVATSSSGKPYAEIAAANHHVFYEVLGY